MAIKRQKTAIWFEMDEETNRLLTAEAKKNQRSKRSEALHRLRDSLVTEYKARLIKK